MENDQGFVDFFECNLFGFNLLDRISNLKVLSVLHHQTLLLVGVIVVSGQLWSSLQLDVYIQTSGQRGDMATDRASADSPPVSQKL